MVHCLINYASGRHWIFSPCLLLPADAAVADSIVTSGLAMRHGISANYQDTKFTAHSDIVVKLDWKQLVPLIDTLVLLSRYDSAPLPRTVCIHIHI